MARDVHPDGGAADPDPPATIGPGVAQEKKLLGKLELVEKNDDIWTLLTRPRATTNRISLGVQSGDGLAIMV